MFNFFDKLPNEMIVEVLKQLQLNHQLTFTETCKRFNEIVRNYHIGAVNQDEKNALGARAFYATRAENKSKLLKVLNLGADANVTNEVIRLSYTGGTLLCLAAQENMLNIAETLIEKGTNINKQNNFGFTALHYAALRGNAEMCKFLIHKGADKNIETNFMKYFFEVTLKDLDAEEDLNTNVYEIHKEALMKFTSQILKMSKNDIKMIIENNDVDNLVLKKFVLLVFGNNEITDYDDNFKETFKRLFLAPFLAFTKQDIEKILNRDINSIEYDDIMRNKNLIENDSTAHSVGPTINITDPLTRKLGLMALIFEYTDQTIRRKFKKEAYEEAYIESEKKMLMDKNKTASQLASEMGFKKLAHAIETNSKWESCLEVEESAVRSDACNYISQTLKR